MRTARTPGCYPEGAKWFARRSKTDNYYVTLVFSQHPVGRPCRSCASIFAFYCTKTKPSKTIKPKIRTVRGIPRFDPGGRGSAPKDTQPSKPLWTPELPRPSHIGKRPPAPSSLLFLLPLSSPLVLNFLTPLSPLFLPWSARRGRLSSLLSTLVKLTKNLRCQTRLFLGLSSLIHVATSLTLQPHKHLPFKTVPGKEIPVRATLPTTLPVS